MATQSIDIPIRQGCTNYYQLSRGHSLHSVSTHIAHRSRIPGIVARGAGEAASARALAAIQAPLARVLRPTEQAGHAAKRAAVYRLLQMPLAPRLAPPAADHLRGAYPEPRPAW
jgi:hypothetical protein